MPTNVAKLCFSDEEKLAFKPLFVKYIHQGYSSPEILAALKGDNKLFARFKLYADGLKAIIQQRQDSSKIAALQKSKLLLTQSILESEAAIKVLRDSAVEIIMRTKAPLRIS